MRSEDRRYVASYRAFRKCQVLIRYRGWARADEHTGPTAFTLVELMVTVAIVAVLAAVAVPAYVHHVRRSEQSQAVEALLTARMELEAFWADHNRYAGTLRLLPSFESATQGKYVLTLKTSPDGQRYRIEAMRPDVGDLLHLCDNETKPVVDTPKALGWSLFQWVFD
ncbi:MAG: type IV pilin protein [Desulfosoma sp.]